MAATVAKKAQVKRLVLFHHEPLHDDRAMQAIERRAKRLFPGAMTAQENGQIKL
jgi:ribonuclease BN (tRNA processing enzyme)